MHEEDMIEESPAGQPDRRKHPRHPVDDPASLLVVDDGSDLPGRIVELSAEGCRVRTKPRYDAGTPTRVEVNFKLNGIEFRFLGVIQWTDDENLVGVQFVNMTDRRREQLREMVHEVEADNIAKAARELAEEKAEQERMLQQMADEDAAAKAAEAAALEPPKPVDSRRMARYQIDGVAKIHFINLGLSVRGRIVDLSLTGCGIRTDDPFPGGIMTRVEIEFQCEGLLFRLIGVIADIHDPRLVGIRFLDVTIRKKAQLEALIEEIQEFLDSKAMAPQKNPEKDPGKGKA
jgi:c-di-GMP-binding flagellar brake protein YcgR